MPTSIIQPISEKRNRFCLNYSLERVTKTAAGPVAMSSQPM